MSSPQCLSEDDVIALVDGRLTGESLAVAERHLSICERCPRIVAETARATSESGSSSSGAEDEPPPPLIPGDQVGRYVVERSVGEGAMGRVYAAHDPELDRVVALKVLHPRVASRDLEARLKREAKAMARVSEPEVIAVFDAGRHGKQLFIAMELVDGGTLRQWIAEKRRPWRDVLAVFLRAARGLAHAHAAGLVHRDFKPDNVLIGKDGRVRVTDFGLARVTEANDALDEPSRDDSAPSIDASLTRTGTLVGTPAYMSPEQMTGAPADARADIYACCISLYEALYRERPFTGTTFAALQRAKSEGRVRPPPTGTDVPARVRRAILVGLAAREDDRYASVDAMIAALERASRSSRAVGIVAAVGFVAIAGIAALVARERLRASAPIVGASSSASTVALAPTCSAVACTARHDGVPHACRPSDGACVPIASVDCIPTFEAGDLQADDTLWLGAMLPTTGPAAAGYGKMNADGVDFARKEIADATRTLEKSNASKHVRRIALVTCDDAVDPERAARHLVEDLGVPAIVGFGSGQKLIDLAGPILIPHRVLSIASLSSNPLVTRVPQPADLPRMIWRTTYSWHDVAAATARFLRDVLEPRAGVGAGATRVTVARIDMPAGLWFSEELYRRLVFNGKSAVDNGAAYQEITVPASPPELSALRALADRIVATRPTFVLLSGATAVTTPLIREIESRWPARGARPTYVVSDNSTETLAEFMGTDVERRRRIFAVTPPSNERPAARFVIRYNAAHATSVTRYLNPGSGYDALYMLAYAAFALGEKPIDGPSLARTFARLVPPGKSIEVGPMALFDGIAALQRGESIDLLGAAGALDFDLATGEAPSDFALVCAGVDAHGRAAGDVESGVFYRASSEKVDGSIRCP